MKNTCKHYNNVHSPLTFWSFPRTFWLQRSFLNFSKIKLLDEFICMIEGMVTQQLTSVLLGCSFGFPVRRVATMFDPLGIIFT